jgi:hypothetical protein
MYHTWGEEGVEVLGPIFPEKGEPSEEMNTYITEDLHPLRLSIFISRSNHGLCV